MNYAFINGKILDGTKDIEVQEGLCILTNGKKIVDIVPTGSDLDGYEKVDLGGKVLIISMSIPIIASLLETILKLLP